LIEAAALLDEPSSGLDPSQRVRLWEFVAGLSQAGTTVIYSTHQIDEASHYGDRLVVLADGETIFVTGADAASRPARALRVRIGERESTVVHEEPDELFFVSPAGTMMAAGSTTFSTGSTAFSRRYPICC
jgi:ABC-type multidrug transport system ATPase subunit